MSKWGKLKKKNFRARYETYRENLCLKKMSFAPWSSVYYFSITKMWLQLQYNILKGSARFLNQEHMHGNRFRKQENQLENQMIINIFRY